MGQLTESARQILVSQGVAYGSVSAMISLMLLFIGIAAIIRANDILLFTSLIYITVLQITCGITSLFVVSWVCWFVVGYKQRQMEVRSKYLDDNLTKGLAILFLPLLLTYSALIVCLVFLFIKSEITIEHEIKSSIAVYSSDNKSKMLIDRLQIILRCCGSISLADWFMTDWQGPPEKNNPMNLSLSLAQPDWDAVPFSCCKIEAPPPCSNKQLQNLGVNSLYTKGCARKLNIAGKIFVVASFIMFLVLAISMSCLLFSSRKLQTSARAAIRKGDATAPGNWWIFSDSSKRVEQRDFSNNPAEEELLLERRDVRRTTSHFSFRHKETKCVCPVLVLRRSKIIDSRIDSEDWTNYDNAEIESSEDWASRVTDDISASTSASSFQTVSLPYDIPADSRRSVSDTAVANLEISQHYEHKVCPLFRT